MLSDMPIAIVLAVGMFIGVVVGYAARAAVSRRRRQRAVARRGWR
jgi:hypothetical protein